MQHECPMCGCSLRWPFTRRRDRVQSLTSHGVVLISYPDGYTWTIPQGTEQLKAVRLSRSRKTLYASFKEPRKRLSQIMSSSGAASRFEASRRLFSGPLRVRVLRGLRRMCSGIPPLFGWPKAASQ